MVLDNLKNKSGTASPELPKEGDGHTQPDKAPQGDQGQKGDKTSGAGKTTSEKRLIGELLQDGKEVLNMFRNAFGLGGGSSKPAEKPAENKQTTDKPASEKQAGDTKASDKPAEKPAPDKKTTAD